MKGSSILNVLCHFISDESLKELKGKEEYEKIKDKIMMNP
ncbi:hypothetical protein YN1HA_18210 [Sulfurisphaera ohwakuensis]